MEGPVLSGGVIVLISVLLWLLYLLPSWRGRHQYLSVERDAVRLNQALRVLVETSDVPVEVQAELSVRGAHAQQKLAKRVQAQREAERLEALRAELAATRVDPVVQRARARRRMRLFATVTLLAGLAVLGFGVWQLAVSGAQALLWSGGAAVFVAVMVLQRMAVVGARTSRRQSAAGASLAPRVAPPLHDQGPATWTPRQIPAPMVLVAGSRAQAAHLGAEEQRARREASYEEELRRRAERMAPPAPVALPAAGAPDFSRMGYVDDAEIDAHMRQLLTARVAG